MKGAKDATPARCPGVLAHTSFPGNSMSSHTTPWMVVPLKMTHFPWQLQPRELHLHLPSPSTAPKLLLLLHQLLVTSPRAALLICLLPDAIKDSLNLEYWNSYCQELLCWHDSLSQGPAFPVRPNAAPLPVTAPPRTAGPARPGRCCKTHSSGTSCPAGGTAPWSGHCSRCKGSARTQGREGEAAAPAVCV